MVKKRMKAAAIAVPQTMEEAIDRLARFSRLEGELEELKLAADAGKAEIDAERDSRATPIVAELKQIVSEMKPFWEARRQEITGGKRKSVVLGGCEIGTRTGNPTLTFVKGREDDLLQELETLGFDWAIRQKPEFDKPAIIKALSPNPESPFEVADAAALTGLGFGVRQTETFFIARATSEPAEAGAAGKATA